MVISVFGDEQLRDRQHRGGRHGIHPQGQPAGGIRRADRRAARRRLADIAGHRAPAPSADEAGRRAGGWPAGQRTGLPASTATLSVRESEVLGLIAKGFNFAEIARLLEVSPHTITAHVKKIYQ
jgi:DNA-binding CsgD family transcriptional regulator